MFGVKEVHKVKSGAEVTDRIVGQYNIRLVEELQERIQSQRTTCGRVLRKANGRRAR